MNKNHLVSIVLATCNGARYLTQQIQSILVQTYRNLEVIISDDCSDDETLSIAQKFASEDNRVRVFCNERRLGVGPNFLKAMERSRGEFICFCDQDDSWRNDKVELLAGLISNSAQTMMVYSDLEVCDEALNRVHASFWNLSTIHPVKGLLDERILLRNLTPGCSMMFRREVKDMMLRTPNEGPLLHDHFAFVTSCGMGRVSFTTERLVKYRQHRKNVIGVSRKSLFSTNAFILNSRKLIARIESNSFPDNRFDLKKLTSFLDVYSQKTFGRLQHLKYYLFIHPHTTMGKIFAFCECFLPKFYYAIRGTKS